MSEASGAKAESDGRASFGQLLTIPLIRVVQGLRSEAEYDRAPNPEMDALGYLKQIVRCFGYSAYIARASGSAAASKVRSHKSLVPGGHALGGLASRHFEVQLRDETSRLVAVLDLHDFSYDHSADWILHWTECFVVLTSFDLDRVAEHVRGWVATDSGGVLSFDFERVLADLSLSEEVAIMRYLPADNGKSEKIVAIGHGGFLENRFEECCKHVRSMAVRAL